MRAVLAERTGCRTSASWSGAGLFAVGGGKPARPKISILSIHSGEGTYSQVSRLSRICLASCERCANLVRQFMLARSQAGDGDPLPYGILLEFDGHGDNGSLDNWRVCRCARVNRRGSESVGKVVRIGERLDVYCVYSSVKRQPRQRSG